MSKLSDWLRGWQDVVAPLLFLGWLVLGAVSMTVVNMGLFSAFCIGGVVFGLYFMVFLYNRGIEEGRKLERERQMEMRQRRLAELQERDRVQQEQWDRENHEEFLKTCDDETIAAYEDDWRLLDTLARLKRDGADPEDIKAIQDELSAPRPWQIEDDDSQS